MLLRPILRVSCSEGLLFLAVRAVQKLAGEDEEEDADWYAADMGLHSDTMVGSHDWHASKP